MNITFWDLYGMFNLIVLLIVNLNTQLCQTAAKFFLSECPKPENHEQRWQKKKKSELILKIELSLIFLV